MDNTDAHFLNRNYRRTGCTDVQTDQQHSTSHILICWLMLAWAARCCAMPRSWFDFQIFIRVSNRIFLEFFVRVSSCLSIKRFDYRGSTVYIYIFYIYFFMCTFTCPIINFIVIPVYPHIDDWPYTIYIDIYYTIILYFYKYLLDDEPFKLKTCRRYCVKLNYSRCAFGWYYIVIIVSQCMVKTTQKNKRMSFTWCFVQAFEFMWTLLSG